MTSRSEDESDSSSQKDGPKGQRKTLFRFFGIVAIVVLYNILSRSLFSHSDSAVRAALLGLKGYCISQCPILLLLIVRFCSNQSRADISANRSIRLHPLNLDPETHPGPLPVRFESTKLPTQYMAPILSTIFSICQQ
jgi:hypothetical protein